MLPTSILGAANTYTGATFIAFNNGGGVQLNVSNALPIGTDLIFGKPDGTADAKGAYLDLHGNNQQIGSLCTATAGTKSSNYQITNESGGTSTLTVSGTITPYEPFAGYISDGIGTVALVKSGPNTLVLSTPGGNQYYGGTTVAGGTISSRIPQPIYRQ